MPTLSRRSFLAAAGLSATAAAVSLPTRAFAAYPSVTGATWMSALPATLTLAQLTIPGTHDSGSTQWGALVQCQDTSIAQQLAMGVRFLDIRCYNNGSHFAIYHGGFYQNLMFTDVLAACRTFLTANPGETVLMCLKQEYSSTSDASMNAVYNADTAAYRDLIVDDGLTHALGDVRGRIVIVSRCLGIPGMPFSSWDIEDHYDIFDETTWHNVKWPAVQAHLDAARATPNDGRMWMTFTSSTGALNPRMAANLMGPALDTYFAQHPAVAGERDGIVALDFATAARVQEIGARNFGRATWA